MLPKLPTVPQSALNVRPIDWSVIPPEHRSRFLNPGEMEVIVALTRDAVAKANCYTTMVEFGCQNGRTAAMVLNNVQGLDRYIGIDVPRDYVTEKVCQRGEVPVRPGEFALSDPRFRLWLAGQGSHDLELEDFFMPMNVAFIDGDHARVGVLNDLGLARRSMGGHPGLIIFHDYNEHRDKVDVPDVLEELRANGGHDIQHVEGTWLAFLRVN